MTKSKNIHKSWIERLKSIEEFIEKNDRLPSQRIKEETYNAKFLNLQKNKLKNNLLSQEKAEFFTNLFNKHMHYFVPQSKKLENEWQSRLKSVEEFIEKHNRFPSGFYKNERSDYEFLRRQRNFFQNNLLSEERADFFKAFLNKHQQYFTQKRDRFRRTYWQSRLNSISLFIEKHKRLPKRYGENNERPDYDFLHTQKIRFQKNKLLEERILPFKAFMKKHQQYFPK